MNLLFVCKANVGRSQMAQAFYEKYARDPHVRSAGYDPGHWDGKTLDTTVHVKACMDEVGIDVRRKISKKITKELVTWANKIIVFDANKEDWPEFLRNSAKVQIWEIDDPKDGDLAMHQRVRDEIKRKIEEMV